MELSFEIILGPRIISIRMEGCVCKVMCFVKYTAISGGLSVEGLRCPHTPANCFLNRKLVCVPRKQIKMEFIEHLLPEKKKNSWANASLAALLLCPQIGLPIQGNSFSQPHP